MALTRKKPMLGQARLEREKAEAAELAAKEAAELKAQEDAQKEQQLLEAKERAEQKDKEVAEKRFKRSTSFWGRLWGNLWYTVIWGVGLIVVFVVVSTFATMVANHPDGVGGALSEIVEIIRNIAFFGNA